jgi:hypothetical protein
VTPMSQKAEFERMCMDLAKSRADSFCHIPLNLRRRSGSLGTYVIANRAHTHGFRSIFRDVRKLSGWMVVRVGFEPMALSAFFIVQIVRAFG